MLLADPIKDSEFDWHLTACGRKLPSIAAVFPVLERPLLGKADIQNLAVEICVLRGRFTLDSGH